jgi:hypothetical protein
MTSTAMATAQQIDVEVDGGTLTAEIRGERHPRPRMIAAITTPTASSKVTAASRPSSPAHDGPPA